MKVIGVTGMPGSGKSVVSRVAEDMGMEVIRMGDVIRDEAEERNEDPGKVAIDLRKEFGKYIVAKRSVDRINAISNDQQQMFLIEGIRSPWEVRIFKENFPDFRIIAVHSKPETRFLRLKKRMRSDDSTDDRDAIERDQRELKFGIGEVIANADFMVVNERNINILKNAIKGIFKNEL